MNVTDGPGFSRYEILLLAARLSFVTAVGFFTMKWFVHQLDPTNAAKKKAKKKVGFLFSIDLHEENIIYLIIFNFRI